LQSGLKLLVAAFLGVLLISVCAFLVIAPVAGIVVASGALWGFVGAIGLGVLTLVPLAFVALAFTGIMTSSVWTIGYLTQVEQ